MIAKKQNLWIPQIAAIVLLLIAFNPNNPYGYYILLRWLLFGIFTYLAYRAFELRKTEWLWILAFTGLIYNPIIPLHLGRDIWTLVNIITILIAVGSIFAPRKGNAR